MNGEVLQAVCDQRHDDLDRRIANIEAGLSRVEHRLESIVSALAANTIWATLGKICLGAVMGAAGTLAVRQVLGG